MHQNFNFEHARVDRATFRVFLVEKTEDVLLRFTAICANCTLRYACPSNFIYHHRSFYFYLRLSSHASSYQQYDAFPLAKIFRPDSFVLILYISFTLPVRYQSVQFLIAIYLTTYHDLSVAGIPKSHCTKSLYF